MVDSSVHSAGLFRRDIRNRTLDSVGVADIRLFEVEVGRYAEINQPNPPFL